MYNRTVIHEDVFCVFWNLIEKEFKFAVFHTVRIEKDAV